MRKSILKAASAVMIMAAILLVMPMTAKATPLEASAYDPAGRKNVVAKIGYLYTMPIRQEDGSVKDHDLDFEDWSFDQETVPAGYESKVVYIVYSKGNDNATYRLTAWSINGKIKDGVAEENDWGETVVKFTIDYNGKTYPGCRVLFRNITDHLDGIGLYCVLPQGYNGDLVYTMWGVKSVNGELVKDENSWLQYYLSGDGTSEQPTPELTDDTTPAPAAVSGQTYTTKRGDNLMKIAKEWYGDQEKWKDIYEANKGLIKKPNLIFANMQLIMP